MSKETIEILKTARNRRLAALASLPHREDQLFALAEMHMTGQQKGRQLPVQYLAETRVIRS